MGVTKYASEDVVRWDSKNQSIDPNLSHWDSDPRKDGGHLFPAKDNTSCLMLGFTIPFTLRPKWGVRDSSAKKPPTAIIVCERKTVGHGGW